MDLLLRLDLNLVDLVVEDYFIIWASLDCWFSLKFWHIQVAISSIISR